MSLDSYVVRGCGQIVVGIPVTVSTVTKHLLLPYIVVGCKTWNSFTGTLAMATKCIRFCILQAAHCSYEPRCIELLTNVLINFIHGWLNRQWWWSKPINYDIIPALSMINTVCRQSNCYSAVSLYMVGLGIQYLLVLTHARNGVRSWKFVRKCSHFASHVRCRWSV